MSHINLLIRYRLFADRGCSDSQESSSMYRRRFQKRMCMRRKRARERGEDVNTSASLLKRGRRSNDYKLPWLQKSNVGSSEPIPTQEHESSSNHLMVDLQQPPLDMNTDLLENEASLIHIQNLRNFLR
jgi:hypothetical protein